MSTDDHQSCNLNLADHRPARSRPTSANAQPRTRTSPAPPPQRDDSCRPPAGGPPAVPASESAARDVGMFDHPVAAPRRAPHLTDGILVGSAVNTGRAKNHGWQPPTTLTTPPAVAGAGLVVRSAPPAAGRPVVTCPVRAVCHRYRQQQGAGRPSIMRGPGAKAPVAPRTPEKRKLGQF